MRKTGKISSLIILAVLSIALTFGLAGCNKNNTQDTSVQNQPAQGDQTQDPAAAANLAPTAGVQNTGTNVQQDQNYSNEDYDADYQDTSGQQVVESPQPPPPLPEYSQPDCPGDGYLWTPGYWGYASQGYYWVPGAWTQPPEVGLLWTPGYWDFYQGAYRYHNGFWGQHIGYYGGINYGFGYVGTGYQGGYWSGNRFNYNRSVNNMNTVNIQVYNRTITNTVLNDTTTNRASFNGPGGVTRRPLPAEIAAAREKRVPPMTTQLQQQRTAGQDRQQFAAVNNGRPAVFAAAKPIPEGKPIAPVIPARPAAATQPEPRNAQPNRTEPAPERPAAPAPTRPAEPARKTVEPEQPAVKPGAPPSRTTPAPAPAERRAQPSEQPARPQPERPVNPPPKAAPKAEPRPATPRPAEMQTQRPVPTAKPKTPPPPAKKESPNEKPKPE